MKKNDVLRLQITGMTAEGAGVGHSSDGMAVFVPATAVGDEIDAHIVKVQKSYAFGKTQALLAPGSGRTQPDCPAFPRCGGCVYRHITYETECQYKHQKVQDAFTRIGGFSSLPVSPLLAAEDPQRYRNKAQYPIGQDADGKLTLGFYAVNSHRIIPTQNCLLQPAVFADVCRLFLQFAQSHGLSAYNEETGKGLLRHLYLRQGAHSGEIMVCVVIAGNTLPFAGELVTQLTGAIPAIKTVVLNHNTRKTNVILGERYTVLYGDGNIHDTMCGLKVNLSAPSFYQVNTVQAERLYRLAGKYALLTGQETVLDLYCGAGLIGLSMAGQAKKIIGAEIVPEAVENAKQNAAENGIPNAEFLCADAAKAAEIFRARGICPDVVLVDPPRKGLTPELIATMVAMAPQRVVYVSCDPATLARDCKLFAAQGYMPQRITPVDLFPRTSHVETVVLMSRANK